MGFFNRAKMPGTPNQKEVSPADTPLSVSARNSSIGVDGAADTVIVVKEPKATAKAWFLGAIASLGGFLFGYESGQISGKLLSIMEVEPF